MIPANPLMIRSAFSLNCLAYVVLFDWCLHNFVRALSSAEALLLTLVV